VVGADAFGGGEPGFVDGEALGGAIAAALQLDLAFLEASAADDQLAGDSDQVGVLELHTRMPSFHAASFRSRASTQRATRNAQWTVMKAGVGIDPGLGLSGAQQRALVQESARLGYDSLWMPASAAGRSVFHTAVEWWRATTDVIAEGLRVGISVVPFPVWTVPTLAAQSATVSEITSGKFILGIGLGGYPSEPFRKQWGLPLVPPVALTRDFLCTLRALLAGETVEYEGKGVTLHGAQLGGAQLAPRVPVSLGALGPQMLRLSGEQSDGVAPNWSSPEQIAWMRERVAAGALKAGRQPSDVPFTQYIRVCIDEDEQAARRAFATQVLGYAMARPGQPKDQGYRAHFGRMGFEEILTELEARREKGARISELVDAVPSELLLRVGYFGRRSGAAEALRRLSRGLDEATVRLIAARPGDLDALVTSVRACEPGGWAAR
jgi:alkanesulfonate monooxygenase SsuD/methylene tetrahydromethanopterin reductase-like flavin-dependent oxidoreductase (luciferase family)